MQISNSYKFVACWSDKQGWARIIAQFRRIKACKMNVGVRARRKQQVVREDTRRVSKLGMAADAGARLISQFYYLFSMTPPHARCSLTSKKHFEFVH
jgi:hypothetical protein